MRNLIKKIEAFRRKNNIDCIKSEKEGLKNIILGALRERGQLNRIQRSQVLHEVVEQWKLEEEKNEAEQRKAYLEAEKSNDVSKGIALFNLGELIKS